MYLQNEIKPGIARNLSAQYTKPFLICLVLFKFSNFIDFYIQCDINIYKYIYYQYYFSIWYIYTENYFFHVGEVCLGEVAQSFSARTLPCFFLNSCF